MSGTVMAPPSGPPRAPAPPAPLPGAAPPGDPDRLRFARSATAWLGTAPGKLARLLAALLLGCLVLGVAGVWTAVAHQDAAANVAGRDDRLSRDAQQIYRSLADADATAASAYLFGAADRPELRSRYLADLTAAQTALRDATTVAGGDPATASAIDVLTGQISVYTGVVETARAENRHLQPVGGSYLSEASNLMRTRLLPAADRLFAAESARLRADQDTAGGFGYAPVAAALLLLVLLWYAQRRLARQTRRTLNAGLLGATLAVALSLVWTLAALGVQSADSADSRALGSAQRESLARAETAALKARSDENLLLVSGGQDTSATDDYQVAARDLDRYLTQAAHGGPAAAAPAVTRARTQVTRWRAAHDQLVAADENGRFNDAVASAITDRPGTAAGEFGALHDALEQAIAVDQRQFASDASDARDDVTALAPGLGLLALLAAAACASGLGERLREYR